MKLFKDENDVIYAYEADGSQDHLIGDKTPITQEEADQLRSQKEQARYDVLTYAEKRRQKYPELGEFVDAWVKKDEAALEEYRQKCLAVKAQFPKPEGF
jgi:hypothetical protein